MNSSLLCGAVLAVSLTAGVAAGQTKSDWPAPVKDFVPLKAGEHPRLFFRPADLPTLRDRAKTPEGKMIIERTKFLLDGADHVRDQGKFTLWDGAAFGFLFQVTGEQKYADLARQSVDAAWSGRRDKDGRYGVNPPDEPLRAGPSISAMAMAYDLAYTGWPADYRKEQAQKIMTWSQQVRKKGGKVSLEQLSLRPVNPNPISNHFGLQVGGAGITILALKGDPELTAEQQKLLEQYQAGVDKNLVKTFTYDHGQTGYFGEHAGPGTINTTWTITPLLAAERIAHGRDWLSNPAQRAPEWLTLRFVMQTLPTPKGPMYTNPTAGRGGYGGDEMQQDGGHHATYFCQGFGAVRPQYRPALQWVYEKFVEPLEQKQYAAQIPSGQKSFDAFGVPHRPMFSFVFWPIGQKAENPEKTMPKAVGDPHFGQYIFRNRWQDENDTIVAILFGARTDDKLRRMMVWSNGQQMTFGNVTPVTTGSGKVGKANVDNFVPLTDGSGSVSAGGSTIGVDYSGTSGAQVVVVMTGPAATGTLGGSADKTKSKVHTIESGGVKYSILTVDPSGKHPAPADNAGTVALGGQTIKLDGNKIVFGKSAAPLK